MLSKGLSALITLEIVYFDLHLLSFSVDTPLWRVHWPLPQLPVVVVADVVVVAAAADVAAADVAAAAAASSFSVPQIYVHPAGTALLLIQN